MSESRPTPSEWASRTVARLRSRGPVEVADSLRGQVRSAIGSGGILEFLARETAETCPERDDLTIRAASFTDAVAYEKAIGTDSSATFRARLTDTTSCYLVSFEQRIAHASWVTTSAAWTGEIRAFATPPDGSAYVYESFTDPALRGRGIYPWALRCICAELSSRGVQRVWIGVERGNVSSVRAISKAGFEPAFSVRYRRRLGRLSTETPAGPKAEIAGQLLSKSWEG